ncbi:MAG TPA: alpha/beta hydrolase-fold protein [Candidatus Krumholzibacteria bacterium]|nr:alpha/beta hydrolase-fold protein [Candidatus Krumholzibacteria bacterium]HPD71034.1 alpha/beta hydrolase-fold protein [Candidatus Krumholzibacteria bacterium]HRY39266.1 alpha/beta hydrolase-fold protein [Candidatus Krumholzibacteria bacterium]
MRVDLAPPPWATHLISDRDDWLRAPRPVAAVAPFDLPDDAYFEYAYLDADGRRRPDPANPNPPNNPWWDYARYLAGPGYRPDPWAQVPDGTGPLGTVARLKLASRRLRQPRHLLVYSPPGTAGARLPQVWFQDGKAYYGWGKAPQVLDRLIAAGQCAPAHLVFVPPSDRDREYAFNDAYLEFLVEEAVPAVEERAPGDGRRAAWGASLGGLCSAELGWRYPLTFQTLVTQSGAFLFAPGRSPGAGPYGGREWWADRVRTEAWRPLRWQVQTGVLEWLHRPNRNLAGALDAAGLDVEYVERTAGHNWTNWRDGLAAGFRFALPIRP